MSKRLILPIIIILVGVTWLLNVYKVMPEVDWMWTVGLAAAGILSTLYAGLNKITVVTGPFLLVASVCSLLRQIGRLNPNHEIPALVILFGVLMLVSHLSHLPIPETFRDDDKKGPS